MLLTHLVRQHGQFSIKKKPTAKCLDLHYKLRGHHRSRSEAGKGESVQPGTSEKGATESPTGESPALSTLFKRAPTPLKKTRLSISCLATWNQTPQSLS